MKLTIATCDLFTLPLLYHKSVNTVEMWYDDSYTNCYGEQLDIGLIRVISTFVKNKSSKKNIDPKVSECSDVSNKSA